MLLHIQKITISRGLDCEPLHSEVFSRSRQLRNQGDYKGKTSLKVLSQTMAIYENAISSGFPRRHSQ